jgi:saccharopine dehydrogenase-like NADP-dependent oxidoreductase
VHNIMMLGAGDLGVRIADALLHRGHVRELTLVDLPNGGGAKSAEAMASCISTPIYFEGINALNSNEVKDVIRRRNPERKHPM